MAAAHRSELVPYDPALIFQTLEDHEVDYLVLGGAGSAFAETDAAITYNVDLLVPASEENYRRLGAALSDLHGATNFEVTSRIAEGELQHHAHEEYRHLASTGPPSLTSRNVGCPGSSTS